jgi:hypothetical protein
MLVRPIRYVTGRGPAPSTWRPQERGWASGVEQNPMSASLRRRSECSKCFPILRQFVSASFAPTDSRASSLLPMAFLYSYTAPRGKRARPGRPHRQQGRRMRGIWPSSAPNPYAGLQYSERGGWRVMVAGAGELRAARVTYQESFAGHRWRHRCRGHVSGLLAICSASCRSDPSRLWRFARKA